MGQTIKLFPPEVQGLLEMKAEILVHPHETGLRALSKAPSTAGLPIM